MLSVFFFLGRFRLYGGVIGLVDAFSLFWLLGFVIGDGFFKALDGGAQIGADIAQTLGAEQHDHDGQNNKKLPNANATDTHDGSSTVKIKRQRAQPLGFARRFLIFTVEEPSWVSVALAFGNFLLFWPSWSCCSAPSVCAISAPIWAPPSRALKNPSPMTNPSSQKRLKASTSPMTPP